MPDASVLMTPSEFHRGDAIPAGEDFYPVVYEELKRIARHQLHGLPSGATLSTTELVHETFLKLAGNRGSSWEGRAHFFGAASRAMRQILVDFARRRTALKRGGIRDRVSLGDREAATEIELDEILALDIALDRLNTVDERLHQIVELRFFGGLRESEVADLLGVTPRTVERSWVKARLFLLRELDTNSLRM